MHGDRKAGKVDVEERGSESYGCDKEDRGDSPADQEQQRGCVEKSGPIQCDHRAFSFVSEERTHVRVGGSVLGE
jgi:hypothetical protein